MDDLGYEITQHKKAQRIMLELDGHEADLLARLLGDCSVRNEPAKSAYAKLRAAQAND